MKKKSRQARAAKKPQRLIPNPLSTLSDLTGAMLKGGNMVLDSMQAAAKRMRPAGTEPKPRAKAKRKAKAKAKRR